MGAQLQFEVDIDKLAGIRFNTYEIKNNIVYLLRDRKDENFKFTLPIYDIEDIIENAVTLATFQDIDYFKNDLEALREYGEIIGEVRLDNALKAVEDYPGDYEGYLHNVLETQFDKIDLNNYLGADKVFIEIWLRG